MEEKSFMICRDAPTNLDCEPPYPSHATVVVSIRAPEMTAHFRTERCEREEPHLIAECGEFLETLTERPDNLDVSEAVGS